MEIIVILATIIGCVVLDQIIMTQLAKKKVIVREIKFK